MDIKIVVWAVDDDKAWLAVLKSFLKKHGVDLFVFDRHEDFFIQLEEIKGGVDIILMDVQQPNFNIRNALKQIYSINKRIKVILMSSCIDAKELNGLWNAGGIFRFVEKGDFNNQNNIINYMGKLMSFNCFEAIRLFIEQAKEHLLLTQPIHEQLQR
jgi:response regulator RpfG family c-di-GMP phosphodiesterase